MTNENTKSASLISSIKSNWAAILAICAAIATIINFYWKADEFIVSRTKEAIKTEIEMYHQTVESERDSIVSNISETYFEPLQKQVKYNTYFLNASVQGLNAEFTPYYYNGKTFYRSDANASGYSMYWHIFERDHRWEIYPTSYNATCDCFEFYDIVERKKKRIR